MQLLAKPKSPDPQKGKSLFKTQNRKFFFIGLAFSLPWIIGFLCFQIFPLGSAIYYGFTDFDIFNAPTWIGLSNFTQTLTDPKFYTSLYNTAYMAFIGLPVGLLTALALALLLNTNVRGMSFWRTIFYMPTVAPVVACTMIFVSVFNPNGILNDLLKLFGVKGPNWISDPMYTKPMLIIMDSWRCGQSMIVFLAALKAVPKSFYEAAEIDGAGFWRMFTSITLPSISPTILFLSIMGLIQSFQYFTQGYVLAQVTNIGGQTFSGGPDKSLLFTSAYLYQNGFTLLKMGYACSQAVILFIIIIIATASAFKVIGRGVSYDME